MSFLALARFLVNLGADTGLCETGAHWDPANCLLNDDHQFGGLFVDGGTSNLTTNLLPHRVQGIEAVNEYVFPSNVTVFLDNHGVPYNREIDLLKIDVDGAEYAL